MYYICQPWIESTQGADTSIVTHTHKNQPSKLDPKTGLSPHPDKIEATKCISEEPGIEACRENTVWDSSDRNYCKTSGGTKSQAFSGEFHHKQKRLSTGPTNGNVRLQSRWGTGCVGAPAWRDQRTPGAHGVVLRCNFPQPQRVSDSGWQMVAVLSVPARRFLHVRAFVVRHSPQCTPTTADSGNVVGSVGGLLSPAAVALPHALPRQRVGHRLGRVGVWLWRRPLLDAHARL